MKDGLYSKDFLLCDNRKGRNLKQRQTEEILGKRRSINANDFKIKKYCINYSSKTSYIPSKSIINIIVKFCSLGQSNYIQTHIHTYTYTTGPIDACTIKY